MMLFKMLDDQEQQTVFGRTEGQWRQWLSRSCARYMVVPFTHALSIVMHTVALALVIRFVLEVAGSDRMFNSNIGQLTVLLTTPFLAGMWLWMASFPSIRPDTYHALPMILAIAIWVLRPAIADQLKWLADHLEGRSLQKLFQERAASAPRWKSRVRHKEEFAKTEHGSREPHQSRASKEPDYEHMEEYARLLTPTEPDRLAPIGFDAETRIQIIGRYELLQELGRGPMGVVYKAYDLQIGRTVVLKLLNTEDMDEEELRLKTQRLLKEARAAGKLVHAGLVAIFDVSEDERGNPYIVMEYIDGETLEEALTPRFGKTQLSLDQRLDVAIEISRAVEYAHSRGIIHRDLKPSNVILTPDRRAKLVDFGIARLLELPRVKSDLASGEEDDGVPGTPEFVAPELLSGMAAGRASDIFSLGVMLYWMFTGELPFSGRSVTEITYNVAHNNPAPVRQLNWALPAELDELLHRCLAKQPGARYTSAAELAADLQTLRYAHAAHAAQAAPPSLQAVPSAPRAHAG
jgi:tRNA A-37 threonylcarbamoyl transferase component Bud32